MRKKLIAGNWKMNKTLDEAVELAKALVENNQNISDRDIMIAPTFVCLKSVYDVIKGSPIKLGAQNMYFEDSGAYTSEISADMLLSVGCEYVILGHSERRNIFNETNEMINKKIKKALEKGLKPILCVGELLEDRESGKMNEVVKSQIDGSLDGISDNDMKKIIIAYEPVWAIGTGKTATPDDADNMHAFIRSHIADKFSQETADQLRILYGGSVKETNVDNLMSMENIDGALVGGAALKPDSFTRIIKFQ